MRAMKLLLSGLTVAVLGTAAAQAEPIKIRNSWVAPVTNWASILSEKKDLAKHLGQVLRHGAGALSRHAADDHRARQ